jgi:hypothetical protein
MTAKRGRLAAVGGIFDATVTLSIGLSAGKL